MKRLHAVSAMFFLLGIICCLISGLQGNLKVGFFLVFPFIIGSGYVATIGVLFIILAFLLFVLGFSPRTTISEPTGLFQDKDEKPTVKGGGIVLLGPIPIVVGSSWKITVALILAAIVLMLLVFFLFYFK